MGNDNKFYKITLTVLLLILIVLVGLFVKTEYQRNDLVDKNIVKPMVDSIQPVNNDSIQNVISKKNQKINLLEQQIKVYKNQPQKKSNNNAEIKSLKSRIFKLNKQIDFLEAIKRNNDKKLRENNQQIADYKKQLDELNSKYRTGNKNIDSLTIARRNNQAKLEALKQEKSELENTKKTKTTQQQIEERDVLIANLTSKNSQLQQEVDRLKQEQTANVERRKSLEQQVNILTAQNTDLQKQNVDLQKQIAIYNPKKTQTQTIVPNIPIGEKPFVRVTKMNFSGVYQDEEGNDVETQMTGDANAFKLFFVAQTNDNTIKSNVEKDFDIRIIDSITKQLVVFSKDQQIFSHLLKEDNEVDCNLTGSGAFDPKTKTANVEIVFDKTKDWEKKINKKNYYKVEVYCDSMMIGQQTFTLLEGKTKNNKLTSPATATNSSAPTGKKKMPVSF